MVLSVVLSSLFFSMLHGMNQGVTLLAYVNLFLFGVFMALLFIRCENIWIVGAVHSVWNFAQGNLFGVQVSGMKTQPSLLHSGMAEGWELVNGGAFGMEGGLAVTLVLAAGLGILLHSMKKHGDFVEVAPQSAWKQDASIPPQNNQWANGNQPPQENQWASGNQPPRPPKDAGYENMGLNPEETPWHPKEGEEMGQGASTGFDQSYFKD